MDLYDVFQNFRIGVTKDKVDKVSRKTTGNKSEISVLQDHVDHLSLVCQAMCELMENVGFSKEMVIAKIQEIDLRDGQLDGKYVKSHNCPKCSRSLAQRHIKCLYCGEPVLKSDLL
ncbi:hypothetical protein EDC38_2392 [Marinimicrobium koreense]|uniref:Uncharacterized protein n=1 Tax=Marinimicrobium koreense TaxID=306545 RepID=A0A3N1NPS3_9GAMM|nr:hypothetical protein [Marinimicrobium koreense]ROQ21764.1 hypothetical protein EDC38_2392 [Marinimicrobium koreense]